MERTHRPFILMLLDIRQIAANGNFRALQDKIAIALAENTRDIDQRGWYIQDHVMGVIYTEINGQEILQAKEQFSGRIRSGLSRVLSPEEMERISVSMHVYPEGIDTGNRTLAADPALYPDLRMGLHASSFDLMAKRAMDILGSVVALILLLPVIVLIVAAIKLISKGPVLYRQERVGQFGRCFTFLKFRSMHANNDDSIHQEYVRNLIAGTLEKTSGNTVFKIQHDPRVTTVGRFIRRTSLDEIPQFLNVLAGSMSLVGPRPPIPYEMEKYDTWHRQRLLFMKPGITGLWQVVGRSRTTFDEMVRLDIRYIREWSLWLDIRLILATPWVALSGKGGF